MKDSKDCFSEIPKDFSLPTIDKRDELAPFDVDEGFAVLESPALPDRQRIDSLRRQGRPTSLPTTLSPATTTGLGSHPYNSL